MKPTASALTPFAALLFLLGASATARAEDPAAKLASQNPPPHMQDVKTPAPTVALEPGDEHTPATGRAAGPASEPAAVAARSVRQTGTGFLTGLEPTVVQIDALGDGTIWAAGDRYKASFDASGATYIPFFGSRAARTFPVRFSIASISLGGDPIAFDVDVEPVRTENRIVFDRGLVDEVYDLTPDSIEQSFVFESLPRAGELVVRLAVDSELLPDTDANGLVLSGELGAVRYANAFGIDAHGFRSPASTAWSNHEIEIRVPTERVEAGRGFVIDPVISTFTVDTNVDDHIDPDVAYDSTSARWLIVYERDFAATDSDVVYKIYSSSGSLIYSGYIEVSSESWEGPKAAGNNAANGFLVVAHAGSGSGTVIKGRFLSSTNTLESALTISGSETGDKRNPDVGGDPSSLFPSYFCVTWQRDSFAGDRDIHARLVASDGSATVGSTIFVDNTSATDDRYPVISKGNGPEPSTLQDWTIVWQRGEGSNSDIHGAQLHWDGSITTPSFPLETTSGYGTGPRVSSPTHDASRRVLVTYGYDPTSNIENINGRLLQGSTTLDLVNLTTLSGATTAELAGAASVDCDGSEFVFAYMRYGSSFDVRVSTISIVGDRLAKAEGNVALATTADWEGAPEVACAASAGGPTQRACIAWQRDFNVGDIFAAFYDANSFTVFCEPGLDGVIACPCGNAPSFAVRGCNNSAPTGGARLVASGDTSPDTVLLDGSGFLPTSLCIFLQGDGLVTAGVAFGDGVRCTGGQLLRLAVKNAASGLADYPVGSEPSITARSSALGAPIAPGSKRFYSVYYRDPASFACASPATFNISNAVQVQW